MKWFMVLLISLALVGCGNLSGPQRMLGIGLCKAQCPIVKSLALRGCAEIEQDFYDTCVAEAEAVYEACPGLCEVVFPAPTK